MSVANMTAPNSASAASGIRRAVLIKACAEGVTFRQRFNPATGNLNLLSCGEYDLPPATSSKASC